MTSLEASPQIATLSEGDDRYQLRSPLEIANILRGLMAHHALVTAQAGEHGVFFVTAVLEVDDEDGTLVCDYGVDTALTERLLNAPRLTFVTQLDHVRVQFAVSGAVSEDYEGGPAFRVPIPEVVTRLQRREHYRLKVPRGRPLYCELQRPADAEDPTTATRISLPVYDISCGGVALTGWPDDFLPRVTMELHDVWIALPDLGRLVVDLRVVHVPGTMGRGPNAGRFGCRFDNANHNASILVQRYINRIEREQRALL
jgi:c-di-GMP-binding flagellar brake protein YcgR